METFLTNQILIFLIIIAVMLFLFYYLINYMYNKYMFAINNLDNLNKDMNALSTETQKLNEISTNVESKVSSFLDKSKPKSEVSRTDTTSWDPFNGIFPNGIDPKIIMTEVYKRDPEMAQKIISKMSEKTIVKRNTEPSDSMYQ